MSPLELFIVLVFVAFVGGARASRAAGGLWGLPSGVEYVALGFLVGPRLLALVTKGAIDDFEPLLLMAVGWMLAVHGAHYGTYRGRFLGTLPVLFSVLATSLIVALVYFAAHWIASFRGSPEAALLALGLAAVTAESTMPRDSASAEASATTSPRESARICWTSGSELPALLVLGLMMVGEPSFVLPILPAGTGLVLSVALGVALGAIVTTLLGAHFEEGELWPILLGSVMLVVGASLRLELPAVTPAFLVGLTVAATSRHRRTIRALMAITEPQLRLPCLLLAGTVLDWPRTATEWLIVGTALSVRWGGLMILGWCVAWRRGLGPGGGLWLGRQLLRSSAFSVAIGLVVFLRQSDDLGRMVLMTSILSTVFGELLAPRTGSESSSRDSVVLPQIEAQKS